VYVERASRLTGAVLWNEGRLMVAGPDTHAYVTDGRPSSWAGVREGGAGLLIVPGNAGLARQPMQGLQRDRRGQDLGRHARPPVRRRVLVHEHLRRKQRAAMLGQETTCLSRLSGVVRAVTPEGT
jgi:hypothetical protein